MLSGTSKTYSLRIRCPYGDYDDWITLHARSETLEQLSSQPCTFECPTHGAQQAFPLEGMEKQPSSPGSQKSSPLFSPPQSKKSRRASERKPFHVPVVVYGWSKVIGSFHETTTTLMFNANGTLVRLNTPVNLGDKLFIVSKFTQQERRANLSRFRSRPRSQWQSLLAKLANHRHQRRRRPPRRRRLSHRTRS